MINTRDMLRMCIFTFKSLNIKCTYLLHSIAMAKLSSKKKHTAGSATPNDKSEIFELPKQANVALTKTPFFNTPLYDLLHVFERAPDQWAARYILILTAVILRSAVGLGSFSGQGQKPINGDFEAQRHWMEITIHLPLKEWYFYDLQYWGLDYPPLTAYHSWIFGKVGSLINSDWFKLDESRGLETPQIKTFMRYSSLISELIIYIPAIMQLVSILGGKRTKLGRMHQIVVIALILCQPSLILIDHGHFQYNSVMLGFFLFSVIDLLKGNLVLASVWFMSSVLFKQMALYYSPFIFFYILSKLFTPKKTLFTTAKTFNLAKLILIGTTVLWTVFIMVSPFVLASSTYTEAVGLLKQILVRMFPFERGLFEDKVANFWCTSNLVVKYNKIFTNDQLKSLSLAFTLASIIPPCLMCFCKNFKRNSVPPALIIYGFSATAWGFFLFSFQVHEKSVLLPLIPSTFLLLSPDQDTISIIQWINNIGTFSLFPLLKKDGLVLQYTVLFILINWLISGFTLNLEKNLLWPSKLSFVYKLIIAGSYLAVLVFHFVEYKFQPPAQYPDLWVIANTTISFGCFAAFYLWLLYRIYQL